MAQLKSTNINGKLNVTGAVSTDSSAAFGGLVKVDGRIYIPNGIGIRAMKSNYDIANASSDNTESVVYLSENNNVILGNATNTGDTQVRSSGSIRLKCAGFTTDENRYHMQFTKVNFGTADQPAYYGCLRSTVDGLTILGSSGLKFRNVFSTNGVTTTSDRNQKHNIEILDDKYIDLLDLITPVSYIRNNGDRTHVGFIAQDVEEALNKVELTPKDFAGFCKDVMSDDDGNPILNDNGEVQYIYSLRYEEFIGLIVGKLKALEAEVVSNRKEIELLKETNANLEKRLVILEEKLK